jgi:hypothetical protein
MRYREIFIAAGIILMAFGAHAQDQVPVDTQEPAADSNPETQGEQVSNQELQAQLDQVLESQQALVQKDEERQKEIEELKGNYEMLAEEQESAQLAAAEAASDMEKFRVYGFFDMTFAKFFFEDDSSWNLLYPQSNSFMFSKLNLYFASQMTDTLSALAEINFSYMPQGQRTDEILDQQVVIYTSDGRVLERGAYNYQKTTVTDPFTTRQFDQGMIFIERVHLTYQPLDAFGIRAGRFITPYGIWNVDHGSPVIITAREPYMQIREMVPLNQTGIELFGRAFPSDSWFIDYGVTLSNGRGPVQSMFDLDENKGLGARLAFAYQGPRTFIKFGGYGYMGKYRDVAKVRHVEIEEDGTTIDEPEAYRVNIVETEGYKEYIGTADFLLETYGVRLQSEFVYRYVEHSTPRQPTDLESTYSGLQPTETGFAVANFIGLSTYVLLGYTLPLDKHIGAVRIMPYFMYEFNNPNDTQNFMRTNNYIFGVNVKPVPFVVLKLEGNVTDSENIYLETMEAVMFQMAVAF